MDEAKYFAAAEQYLKLWNLERLMMLQGFRPEELLAVKLQHVNLKLKQIRIIEGKSDAAKRTLKLRAEAFDVVADMLRNRKNGSEYLFCAERDPKQKLSLSTCEN